MDTLILQSILTTQQINLNMKDVTQGLEGGVAASTKLSHVDGEAGKLILAGYAVEDLAPHASFEEVAYLFLHGQFPQPSECAPFARDLASRRRLPRAAFEVLREAAAASAPVMDALRMAAPTLSIGRKEDPLDDAMTAIAAFPGIIGAYWRLRNHQEPVANREEVTIPPRHLHPLFGSNAAPEPSRALVIYLQT